MVRYGYGYGMVWHDMVRYGTSLCDGRGMLAEDIKQMQLLFWFLNGMVIDMMK